MTCSLLEARCFGGSLAKQLVKHSTAYDKFIMDQQQQVGEPKMTCQHKVSSPW